MTVRELQELKKQLKEKEKQIKNLSDVASDLDEKLSQERMKKQQTKEKIVEKIVEKIPDDYEQLKSSDNDKTVKINDLTREMTCLSRKSNGVMILNWQKRSKHCYKKNS